MYSVIIILIIVLLPSFYTINKLCKKKDISFFDILNLCCNLNFSITPLCHLKEIDIINIDKFGFFYISFIYSLFIVSYYWDLHYKKKYCIINLSLYLNKVKEIKINKYGYIFIGLILFGGLTYYLPHAAIVVQMEETMGVKSYEETSFLLAYSSILSASGFIILLKFSTATSKTLLDKLCVISYMLIYAFLPRRDFLLQLLYLAIIYYSVHRDFFNKVNLIKIGTLCVFLFMFYFPFYNIIRWNPVKFNPDSPISSLTQIVDYGIDNWKYENKNSMESTKERSLGLYTAVDLLIKADSPMQNGAMTFKDIDIAIPKFINPNKGEGTEEPLQKLAKKPYDIADSYFLLSYADFNLFGGFYALFLYMFVFYLYSKYSAFFVHKFVLNLIPLYIVSQLFSLCWNVEGKFSSALSWFFSSAFIIILLFILEKKKLIIAVLLK